MHASGWGTRTILLFRRVLQGHGYILPAYITGLGSSRPGVDTLQDRVHEFFVYRRTFRTPKQMHLGP